WGLGGQGPRGGGRRVYGLRLPIRPAGGAGAGARRGGRSSAAVLVYDTGRPRLERRGRAESVVQLCRNTFRAVVSWFCGSISLEPRNRRTKYGYSMSALHMNYTVRSASFDDLHAVVALVNDCSLAEGGSPDE